MHLLSPNSVKALKEKLTYINRWTYSISFNCVTLMPSAVLDTENLSVYLSVMHYAKMATFK